MGVCSLILIFTACIAENICIYDVIVKWVYIEAKRKWISRITFLYVIACGGKINICQWHER